MRKQDFCIRENEYAADQRLCFSYMDSTIPLYLNPKFQASNYFQRLHSPVCVRPGRKPRIPVFSRQGSFEVAAG